MRAEIAAARIYAGLLSFIPVIRSPAPSTLRFPSSVLVAGRRFFDSQRNSLIFRPQKDGRARLHQFAGDLRNNYRANVDTHGEMINPQHLGLLSMQRDLEMFGEDLSARIYVVRNQKVMLDSDLARLYGVRTKVLVQAVRRNRERFPTDFMFQLSDQEVTNLRSQIVTSSLGGGWGGRRLRPYAFTEHGVAMLSAVLKSEGKRITFARPGEAELLRVDR